jgi:hypothetical protein
MRQEADWAVTAARGAHLAAADLLAEIDRDLLTELGGRGVLRVEPRLGSTPSPLAELASVWQEYELPFALPFGFDCNSLNGPNAQDLRTRVARMRTTLETR